MGGFWVGADPGGKEAFGLAFWDGVSERPCRQVVSSVDESVEKIKCETIKREGGPLGLAIDAPLWWSSSKGGGRRADRRLRCGYGISPGTVQSANSLRGACLVGGAMLAYRVRECFPGVGITEAHPTALSAALVKIQEDGFEIGPLRDWVEQRERSAPEKRHGWDAAIAAFCAREGFERRWPTDLALHRCSQEENPLAADFRLGPVHYFWPTSPRERDGCEGVK